VKSFVRIFKYIWPQWPRIVVVFTSALLVSVLLSLSFMSVIPLLKVMMGQEGLHGWVDRKLCQWQYGINFYVPESIDYTNNKNSDIGYYLLVTSVKKEGLAYRAGIRPEDRIVGAGPEENPRKAAIPSLKLLEALVADGRRSIVVQLSHPGTGKGGFENKLVRLDNPPPSGLKAMSISLIQHAVAFVPRDQTQESKTKAVTAIILALGVLTIFRCIAKFYQTYIAEKVVQVGINRLREDAFFHVMDMPLGFFNSDRPSDYVSRLVRDTGAMGAGIKVLLGKGLREPLSAVFLLVAAALLNWRLTLIFLCAGPPTLWLVAGLGKTSGSDVGPQGRQNLQPPAVRAFKIQADK
jgi:ABC-type multidrug transport system fused ATPase/permease subunit